MSQSVEQPLHTSIDLSVNRTQPTATASTTVPTDNRATEHTDSNVLTTEPLSPPAETNTNRSTGSATNVGSHQSETNNGASSKPVERQHDQAQGSTESQREESNVEPKSAVKEDSFTEGVVADEVSNPPEEVIEEEDTTEMKDEQKSTTDDANPSAEETAEAKVPVEEVSEELQQEDRSPIPLAEPKPEPEEVSKELQQEHHSPTPPAEPKPEEVSEELQQERHSHPPPAEPDPKEPQPAEVEEDHTTTNGEQEMMGTTEPDLTPSTVPVDTHDPEEIIVRLQYIS